MESTGDHYELLDHASFMSLVLDSQNTEQQSGTSSTALIPFASDTSLSFEMSPGLPSSNSFDSTDQVGTDLTVSSTSSSSTVISKKRKAPSPVWQFFEQLGVEGIRCLLCKKQGKEAIVKGANGGTTGAWSHLKTWHRSVWNGFNETKTKIGNKQRKIDDILPRQSAFDPAVFNVLLAEWIASDDQPFTSVKSPALKAMLCYLNPSVTLPSSVTVRNQIARNFDKNHFNLISQLNAIDSKISITLDMWTSPNQYSFMGVTGHFVDTNFKLHHLLLDFIHVEEKHSGVNLASRLITCLNELGITKKVMAVVMDNARNNDTLMKALWETLEKTLQLEGTENNQPSQIRCLAHVINLGIQTALSSLCCRPTQENTDQEGTPGPLKNLRHCIRAFRLSPQKMNSLIQLRDGREDIKKIKPIIDVPTRWNSTYYMLQAAIELKTPMMMHIATDSDLRNHGPTDEEWNYLRRLTKLLKSFEDVTNFISADSYPTMNLVIPAYNYLMDELENFMDAEDTDSQLHKAAKLCFEKLQRYYCRTDESPVPMVAFSLDPRLVVDYPRRHLWETEFIAASKQKFIEQYAKYREVHGRRTDNDNNVTPTAAINIISPIHQHIYGSRSERRRTAQHANEIDLYYRTAVDVATTTNDVLDWWRENQMKFPILSIMARNFLAVPGSSAPVERIFSSARHTIPRLRYSLKPETIKQCMMEKHRIKQSTSLFDDTDTQEMFEAADNQDTAHSLL